MRNSEELFPQVPLPLPPTLEGEFEKDDGA